MIDLIRLTYDPAPPEGVADYGATIQNIRSQLSEVHQTVRAEQEKDLHTVRGRTESTVEHLRRIQQDISIQLRRHPQTLKESLPETRETVQHIFDSLRADLSNPNRLAEVEALNRAINRLRDLNDYTRMAWESLLWDLECEHQERLERVGQDAARYGRIEFWLAKLGRFGRQSALTVLREGRQVLQRLCHFSEYRGSSYLTPPLAS